jgi:pimeloyl-ACP methyl ester carboxylesterase
MASILLIHGAWHGPWCWQGFVKRLTERGHDVRAVQLRGHDHPTGRIWHRVHHYVEDVERAVKEFSAPPILVGHSLGGLLVQKYLERHAAAKAVLMASVPLGGTVRAAARLAARHPVEFLKVNLLLRLRPLVNTPELVRRMYFTAETPQNVVDHCFAHIQDESYLAFLDSMMVLARPRRVQVPMLVLGAEQDAIFTESEVRSTARAYGVEAEIFPGMGHDMMLDQGWQGVADRIDGWMRTDTQARASARAVQQLPQG